MVEGINDAKAFGPPADEKGEDPEGVDRGTQGPV